MIYYSNTYIIPRQNNLLYLSMFNNVAYMQLLRIISLGK